MNKRYWITFGIVWAISLTAMLTVLVWLDAHFLLFILCGFGHGFYFSTTFDWAISWIARDKHTNK